MKLNNFKAYELVDRATYELHGEKCVQMFDRELLIFIDGLHLAQQAIKDVYNSLDHLNDGGFILMHDCNPPNIWRQRENYSIDGYNYPWNGTTWKAYYQLRKTRADLSMCCVDTDYGVGIIRKGGQVLAPADNTFYDYNVLQENKKEYLNLISCDELNSFLDSSDKSLVV